MIRPFTAVCMLAAGASGLFLYQTKHRAVMLDRQIMGVLKQAEATRERIGAMKAEWALLNEPERLAELSGKHLGLRTLAPTQFVSVADLGNRLPAPAAPGSLYLSAEDAPQPTVTVAATGVAPVATPPVASAAVSAAPAPRVAARAVPAQVPAAAPPAQVASVAPAHPPAPPRPVRTEQKEEAAAPRPTQVASLPNPAPARPVASVVSVAAAPIKAPHPSAPGIGEAVAAHNAAMRAPVAQAAWTPVPAAPAAPLSPTSYGTAQYAPVGYSQPPSALGQSALGGARSSLPPPVPYGAQPR